jgi:hypothetical protein
MLQNPPLKSALLPLIALAAIICGTEDIKITISSHTIDGKKLY